MRPAAELQQLLCALACKLIVCGRVSRTSIPDTPEVESERRQIFFARPSPCPRFSCAGIRAMPCCRTLSPVFPKCGSSRYPGHLRVHVSIAWR